MRQVLLSGLHTMCCHIRAHPFALSVTVMRYSGRQLNRLLCCFSWNKKWFLTISSHSSIVFPSIPSVFTFRCPQTLKTLADSAINGTRRSTCYRIWSNTTSTHRRTGRGAGAVDPPIRADLTPKFGHIRRSFGQKTTHFV